MAATQGRCRPCGVAFRWRGAPLLRNALCPRCRQPLDRTSQQLQLQFITAEHPLQAAPTPAQVMKARDATVGRRMAAHTPPADWPATQAGTNRGATGRQLAPCGCLLNWGHVVKLCTAHQQLVKCPSCSRADVQLQAGTGTCPGCSRKVWMLDGVPWWVVPGRRSKASTCTWTGCGLPLGAGMPWATNGRGQRCCTAHLGVG